VNERRVGRFLVTTFVVSVVFRLTGFIELFWGALTSARETVDAVVSFWWPLICTWVVLCGVVLSLDYTLRQRFPIGDSLSEDEEVHFEELDVPDHPRTKTETLERTLDRAESVLTEQLRVLSDTDDKAVRTVRAEVILLGAIASAAQITQQAIPVNIWMKTGGALVVGSIVAGVFTYSTSSPDFGPGPKYVHSNFEDGDGRTDIYVELLEGHNEAIAHNRGQVNDSGRYLFITQILLVGGLVSGGIGVLIVL